LTSKAMGFEVNCDADTLSAFCPDYCYVDGDHCWC
jgi:hypothetical protein